MVRGECGVTGLHVPRPVMVYRPEQESATVLNPVLGLKTVRARMLRPKSAIKINVQH